MSEEYGLKFVVNGEDYDKIKKFLNKQIEDLQQKVEQLENIRKEAINNILKDISMIKTIPAMTTGEIIVRLEETINILNKGSDKE